MTVALPWTVDRHRPYNGDETTNKELAYVSVTDPGPGSLCNHRKAGEFRQVLMR